MKKLIFFLTEEHPNIMTTNIFNFPLAKDFAAQKDAQLAEAKALAQKIIDFIHLGCFSDSFFVTKEDVLCFTRFGMERDLSISGYKTDRSGVHFYFVKLEGEFKRTNHLFANLLTADELLQDIQGRQMALAQRINKALADAVYKTDIVRIYLTLEEQAIVCDDDCEIHEILNQCGYKTYYFRDRAAGYMEISLPA